MAPTTKCTVSSAPAECFDFVAFQSVSIEDLLGNRQVTGHGNTIREVKRFDLIIIGTGSGNSVLNPDYDSWNVAVIERDAFGGTCLNRGCIPSKMFIYPASVVETMRTASKLGISSAGATMRWSDIRDRVFGRIDPIAESGRDYRRSQPNVTVFGDDARFVGTKQLRVGDETITADTIVISAGARPAIPAIPGLDQVDFHTSATIMRVAEPPARLTVIGGGFIAAELAHVFGSAGSQVTIINRGDRLLGRQDVDIAHRFTSEYAKRFNLVLNAEINSVARDTSGSIVVNVSGRDPIEADTVLVATGRIPNGRQLNVEASGVELDDAGYVVVDEFQRTNVDGVWALGDVSNPIQLKHTANAEQRVVSHNIVNPNDLRKVDYSGNPSAVFATPEVATVGATEPDLAGQGLDYITASRSYQDTAYGWAMEDHVGLCKVIADPQSRTLLGAHILGANASLLISSLVQGMQFGLTVDEMARGMLYIHPALSEVVEQALLELADQL